MSVKHFVLAENEATSLHIGGGCGDVHEGDPGHIEICDACVTPAALAGFVVESVETKKAETKKAEPKSKAEAKKAEAETTAPATDENEGDAGETGTEDAEDGKIEEPEAAAEPKPKQARGRAKKA